MKISKIFYFLTLIILSHKQVLGEKKSYIVYLGAHSHSPDTITSADLHKVTNSHYDFLSSFVGSKEKAKDVMFYSYQRHINGFAAILEAEEAANIAKHPGVVSVFPNTIKKLHTSHSWDFLGLEKEDGGIQRSSLWKRSNFGEDIIIAHIDSGVWPESESFSDSGYGSVPSKWKGICVNDTKTGVPCNRKIIGARYFIKGYIARGGSDVPEDMQTPRDYDGHGTHTLSTSSGNFVNATVVGAPIGTVKGGSPKARVAMYKACWPMGCSDADILQSFDYAIDDGADVISVSLGGSAMDYFKDSMAIGSFHALKKNIVVSASAGNDGDPFTVTNVAPWIITVAASSIDRSFTSAAILSNGLQLEGVSISKTMTKAQYPIIYAENAKAATSSEFYAALCESESIDPNKAKGKILVCLNGENSRTAKSRVAEDAGAVGMIVCNVQSDPDFLSPDIYSFPSVYITYHNCLLLFKYINSTSNPTGYITPSYSKFGIKPSPTMASFSSAGPNKITPDILKPDVTAPGVDILASFSPKAIDLPGQENFNLLSGTSMSCPHVAGVIGLLKKLHPDWSPAVIRSALMTTARSRDNSGKSMTKSDFHQKTTPFDYGAGHIQPSRAADTGLVYDLTVEDHLNFLCAIGYDQKKIQLVSGGSHICPENATVHNFNYPSITVSNINSAAAAAAAGGGGKVVTVSRTLKNVGGAPATYSARIRSPPGVSVTVDPKILKFEKNGDVRSFKLTMKANGTLESFVFGNLVWSDGNRRRDVRTQIVVGPGINI